jgi:hypothetical protein
MKKLLLATLSIVVFTFNGADLVQVAAVIAFTASVYAARLFENRECAASASAQVVRRPQNVLDGSYSAVLDCILTSKRLFQSTENPCAAEHHSG